MRRFLFAFLLIAIPAAAQIVPVDTAIVVTVGPLIDSTDFKTLETAIAYNATGMSVDLIESSGTGAGVKTDLTLTTGSTQDWTHLGNGVYEVEITAAQNDTEGALQVVGVCDGVLPFFSPVYVVVPTLVYNSIVAGSDNLQVDAVQIEGTDATNQINTEADTALTDYDGPTNTELNARTLAAASYFDPATDAVANVTTVATLTGHTPQTADHAASIAAILADTAAVDTQSELRTILVGSDTALATGSALATAQADLDILTGADGVTLATLQANYAPATAAALDTVDNFLDTEIAAILEDTGTTLPATLAGLATASALSTAQGDITAILTDTAAVDTTSELQTLLMGSAVAPASSTALAALNDLSAAEVNTEVDTALTDIHLDHLLAADYDPASKPGVSTALLNELIGSDAGVSQFTANSLELAPGGGSGGDATAANQTTIITALTDIKGSGFSSGTHSLVAIKTAIGSLTGGSGATVVNADSGVADELYYKTGAGAGIEGAIVQAYVKTEYDAGTFTIRAQTTTAADGSWNSNFMLDAGTEYTIVFYKPGPGGYGPDTVDFTP